MKKVLTLSLLIFTSFILFSITSLAVEVSYTWDDGTSHSFQEIDFNKTTISVDGVDIFAYGVVLDSNYQFDFMPNPTLYQGYSDVLHIPSGSWKRIAYKISDSSYYKAESGTYFDDKTLVWTVDDEYVPTTTYHQISYINHLTYVSKFFVEDGSTLTVPSDPTRSGYDFQFWYDYYATNLEEFNFNQPIYQNYLLKAHYLSTSIPEWIYNSSYGTSDYDFHYYEDDSLTHTFSSPVLTDLTIYADGDLIYNRGTTIDSNAYTVSSGTGYYLRIHDVVNATNFDFDWDGDITNSVTTIDNLVIIESSSPQNIYVFDSETVVPFDEIDPYHFDVYRNGETIIKDSVFHETYTVNFFYGAFVFNNSPLTWQISITNYNSSTPQTITRTNDTSLLTFVYTNDGEQTFSNSVSVSYGDVYMDLSGNTLTFETASSDPQTFITANLLDFIDGLEYGKTYKIEYDAIVSSMTSNNVDKFFPVYETSRNNIEKFTSQFYHSDSLVFKYLADTEIVVKFYGVDFTPNEPTSYNIYIDEVLAHEVEFVVSASQLFNTSRISLMNYNPLALPSDPSLSDQLIEHEDLATDPTDEFILNTGGDYNILYYMNLESNAEYDFSDPVVDNLDLLPIIVPNYAYELTFESNGGSHVETQYYYDGDTPTMPPSPTKDGYTFDGWYYLSDLPYSLDEDVSTLNNQSLRDVFQTNNTFINNSFDNGFVGWQKDLSTSYEIIDGYLRFLPGVQYGGVWNDNHILSTGYYYTRYKVKTDINGTGIYILGVNGTNINLHGASYGPIDWTSFSWKNNITSITLGRIKPQSILSSSWSYIYIDDLYNINMSTLGISSLTVSQMDLYYSYYDFHQNGTIPNLTNAIEYDFTQPITDDQILFAKWTENPPDTFTVSYNSMGGSYIAPTTATDGTLTTRPSDPYKEGYDFVGWSTTQVGTTLFDFTTEFITDDLMLYAIWEIPETVVSEDDFDIWIHLEQYWVYYAVGLLILGPLLFGWGIEKRRKRRRF